jgi:hypothetical protein
MATSAISQGQALGDASAGPAVSEGSLLPRFVSLLTPFFAVAAGWLAGVVAKHFPGVQLDSAAVTAFMSAVVLSVAAAAWKWLEGWQHHEARVSQGVEAPIRALPVRTPPR